MEGDLSISLAKCLPVYSDHDPSVWQQPVVGLEAPDVLVLADVGHPGTDVERLPRRGGVGTCARQGRKGRVQDHFTSVQAVIHAKPQVAITWCNTYHIHSYVGIYFCFC